MRFLDKLINFIFSLAMIIISVVIILALLNYTSISFVNNLINDYLWNESYRTIVLVVAVIVFLAGLKTTIFSSDFKKKKKMPIMVNNDNGNVQIAADTVETTAKTVAKSHSEVKDVNAKMINRKKGIDIYMTLLIFQGANIKELTEKIQDEVKETVHNTTGVKVLNIDIRVKNVVDKNAKIIDAKNVVEDSSKNTLEQNKEEVQEKTDLPKVEEEKSETSSNDDQEAKDEEVVSEK